MILIRATLPPLVPAELPPLELGTDRRLIELRPEARPLVQRVLADLHAVGYRAYIRCAYRSPEEQQKKFELGYSLTARPGYHNWGLAADIIDSRWGWEVCASNARFFTSLRASCDRAGLASGGWWGLHEGRIRQSPWLAYGLGWDAAHVQVIRPPKALRTEYRRSILLRGHHRGVPRWSPARSGRVSPGARAILEYLQNSGPARSAEVASATGATATGTGVQLNYLFRSGLATRSGGSRSGEAVWDISDRGRVSLKELARPVQERDP